MSVTVNRTVIDLSEAGIRGQPSAPSSYIVVRQTDGNANNIIATPTSTLPNNTGENCRFILRPPTKAEGAVTLIIVGVNDGDPWYLLGPGGDAEADQLTSADVYTSDDDLVIDRFDLVTARWRLRRIENPTLATLTDAAAETADLASFYAGANARIYAQRSFGK